MFERSLVESRGLVVSRTQRWTALNAVAAARYRPYLLNGGAVDVQTTITVVFTMRE